MIQRPPRTMHISYTTLFETIYYTTDGSTPTTSSAVYSGALTFTQTTTLKAMAAASGMTNSAVASATYTIFSPASPQTASFIAHRDYSSGSKFAVGPASGPGGDFNGAGTKYLAIANSR